MRKKNKITELDITSLIDVLFMLIIFFVLTSSFVSTNLNVELPESHSEASGTNEATNVITLDRKGAFFWNSIQVSKEDVVKKASAESKKGILIVADKHLQYGEIVELLSLLQKNFCTNVGLVTTFSKE